ncbi:MAG: elongation factor G [Bacteroidota bacterium]
MPRTVDIGRVRNIGIMAHIDAGKTTTTERILFFAGVIHRMGEVHEGTAVMDYMEQERERGITITSAATTCFWRDYQINIIDTPGHVDFTAEVQRSLRVLDGAVALFDAVAGVEPQSETVWRQADEYNVPRIAYINKMDRMGADFKRVIEMMREQLAARPIALQMPIGSGDEFEGLIDIFRMKAFLFKDGQSGVETIEAEIPENLLKEASELRTELVEAAIENDDELMEQYLNGEEIGEDVLKSAIRQGVITNRFTAIFCGSSFKNKGVQLLLDAIVDYLPSPEDVGVIEGFDVEDESKVLKRMPLDDEPFSGLAFKILTDQFVGKLVFTRIYSGSLKSGDAVLNTISGKKERVNRLLKMHANRREEIQEAFAGDIVAIPGLRVTRTGDTLCDQKNPVIFEKIQFAEPVINQSIEARTLAEQDKLIEALIKLTEEDPTFRYRNDEESGQVIISGVGELHLEIIVDRLKREFGISTKAGKPQVAYRETITETVTHEETLERQVGAKTQFARVILELFPNERGKGFSFDNQTTAEIIPLQFVSAVEEGARESFGVGAVAGYPVIDVGVRLIGGSFDPANSNELAFKIASSLAIKEAIRKASPVVLEPAFKVEVTVPNDYLGDVVADLSSRRGKIEGISQRNILQVVTSTVPLSEMFGYVTQLRSITQGRGSYNMTFSHYEPAIVKASNGYF